MLAFGAAQLQLGRGRRIGQRLEHRTRIGVPAEDLEQARAGIQAVVEAVPAVLVEDVAAHLAGQRRAGLLQARLDQRMPGARHHRHAAARAHIAGQVAGAFHVVDDRAAGVARQHLVGQQHQLTVGEDDAAAAGDHAQSVAVAVEGQADLAVGLAQAGDQVLQVLGMRGIGVVVGEGAVDLAEQLGHLAPERPVQGRRDRARHAVAAIDGDLHAARQPDVAGDARDVALGQRLLAQAAALRRRHRAQARGRDVLAQPGDGLAVDRIAADHHLQAVVLGRIVAAGDRHAGTGAELEGAVIDDRRGDHADVDDVDTGVTQALGERRRERGPGEPAIAADHRLVAAGGANPGAHRQTDRAHHVGAEVAIDDAADVVGLEDAAIEVVHGRARKRG